MELYTAIFKSLEEVIIKFEQSKKLSDAIACEYFKKIKEQMLKEFDII